MRKLPVAAVKSGSRSASSANPTAKGGAGFKLGRDGGHRNNSVTHCAASGKANKTKYS